MRKSLVKMNKIEIVVPGRDLPIIKEILAGAEVTAYTLIENVSGFGHHGYHQGRLVFNEVASQIMIITVVSEDRVEPVIAPLLDHFQSRSGVFFVSDVGVGRADYFALTMQKILEKSKLPNPLPKKGNRFEPV